MILALLSLGKTVEDVLADYHRSNISAEAIYEAIRLANDAFMTVYDANIFYQPDHVDEYSDEYDIA
jgi:uncharacterized protein (DUF433 family)